MTADAELLAIVPSSLVVVTWAVLTMFVPAAASAATRTASRKDRAPAAPAAVGVLQTHLTDPVPSVGGVVQAPPALGTAERNTVFAGVASVIDTSVAGSGPRFVATSV